MVLSGVLVAGGCSPATVARPPAPPVDWNSFAVTAAAPTTVPPPRERDVAEGYLAALRSPRLGLLASRLDSDAQASFSGSMWVTGRDAVVRLHEVLFAAFDERTFVATRIFRATSVEVIEWTMTGEQARDWMTVATTRKPVAFKGITLLWKKDDGTITDVRVYFDVAVVKGQLGIGPKELRGLPPPATAAAGPSLKKMSTPVEMENVLTVRRALDAFAAQDETAYVSSMADNVEIHTLERAETLRGWSAARKYYEAMYRAIGQLETRIDNVWGIQSFVVVEYAISGLQLGPIDLVPMARDRVVQLHIVDVAQLRDGRISRIWRYDNPGELASDVP